MKESFKKKEIIYVAVLLILCCLIFCLMKSFAAGSGKASVYYNGEKIMSIPLNKDNVIHLDADLPVTLLIEKGSIRFANSECPDKICEKFGRLSNEFEYAVCAPAGVTVIIE